MNEKKAGRNDGPAGVMGRRVLVADDQPGIRSALSLLLEQEPGISVVAEAAETRALLAQVQAVKPDILLIDWELPGFYARETIPALRSLCPKLFVIGLSSRPEASRAAIDAGVDAFVSKGDPPELLLDALRTNGRRNGPSPV